MRTDEHRAIHFIYQHEAAGMLCRPFKNGEVDFLSGLLERRNDPLSGEERARILRMAQELTRYDHTLPTVQQVSALHALGERIATLDIYARTFIQGKLKRTKCLSPKAESKLFELADKFCAGWRQALKGLYCP